MLMLEVCASEAAELLCAGLRAAAGVKAVSAGKVAAVLLSPGVPATRRAISTISSPATCGQRSDSQHTFDY